MSILSILAGFLLLVIGGEFIVRSSIAVSLKFKISKFIIGMTIVAFATSVPELIVSVNAALNNSPSIAINNVIGSNIANIGLVLALISILSPILISNTFYKKNWPIMFIFSVALYLFATNDNTISQLEGFTLLLYLFLFIIYFLNKSNEQEIPDGIDDKFSLVSNIKIFIWLIISSFSLYFGAEFLVYGAKNFAEQLNISDAVISVSIVAIGTSIPELATSLAAILKKEKGISIGNLIGSNIFNIGMVLGITSIIKPIKVNSEIINRDLIWMLIFALIILVLAIFPKSNQISKFKGFLMLCIYIYFLFLAWS